MRERVPHKSARFSKRNDLLVSDLDRGNLKGMPSVSSESGRRGRVKNTLHRIRNKSLQNGKCEYWNPTIGH